MAVRTMLRRSLRLLRHPSALIAELAIRAYLSSLRWRAPAHLARIGREHHLARVRQRAWVLSGAFQVGRECHFNPHINVVVTDWGDLAVKLGDRVALAPNITFVCASGPCQSKLSEIPGFAMRYIKEGVILVGDDTWIGAGVIVLPGVKIGKFCLVGAGSVVTKDVPDYAIVAGVPAQVVGDVRGSQVS